MKKLLLYSTFLTLTFLVSSCSTTKEASVKASKRTAKTEMVTSKNAVNVNRIRIGKYAEVFTGTPYKYAGKDPKGFDCSGYTSYVYSHYGFNVGATAAEQSMKGSVRLMEDTRQGDLIFFGENGKVNHVAIVIDNLGDKLLISHSTSSKGVITEDLKKSKYWLDKYMFAKDVMRKSRRTVAYK